MFHHTRLPLLASLNYCCVSGGNKWKAVGTGQVPRPQEEWVPLPDGTAPAIVSAAAWHGVQLRLQINKEESIRNNKHPQDLGILRCGYCHCAICGRTMNIKHHNPTPNEKSYLLPSSHASRINEKNRRNIFEGG